MAIKISWSSEIPKIIKNFRDGMITLFAGLIPFQSVMSAWFHMSAESFTTICGVAILVVGVIAKMFGVNDTVEIKSYSTSNPPQDDNTIGGGTVGTPKP